MADIFTLLQRMGQPIYLAAAPLKAQSSRARAAALVLERLHEFFWA
ncbi:MAG TPA: hypothetical protein VGY91_03275 [Chthoniobacterales bacterium]|jgi:hypothetical protein|nr:hypothetical protein [Chthoniobacterales bacterium]